MSKNLAMQIANIVDNCCPRPGNRSNLKQILNIFRQHLSISKINRDRHRSQIDPQNVAGRLKEIDATIKLSLVTHLEALGKLRVCCGRDTFNRV